MNYSRHIRWFVLLTVLVNASAMLSPIIHSGDAVIYASIARHIALSHDLARLVLDGNDWLDKPHFPFWMTALFFSMGGVSAATYILPGFLFHLIGAYYTHRLADMLYDKQTAMLAVLIYVSTFSLMDSSIEIKAEAYLRGEILAACYYWLRYDQRFRARDLLLGALFTGMAVMTKGIFTLLTIFSGLVCVWLYHRQWSNFWSIQWLAKWLPAPVLSLLFAAPELIALHVQFNQHIGSAGFEPPVSAFKFFFWDSQFGRFFNTGPIQNHHGYPLYFVVVFLWAFLPWTFLFFAAIVDHAKNPTSTVNTKQTVASGRVAFVFLSSSFLCTFLMFSATTFQMAYYIDIVIPFAVILSAHYLSGASIGKTLCIAQMCMLSFLALVVISLCIYVMNPQLTAVMAAICAGLLCYSYSTRAASLQFRVISRSVLVINMVYVFSILLASLAFNRFSIPANAVKLLGGQPDIPIYVYRMPEVARELTLYSKAPTFELDTEESIGRIQGRYYLIVQHEQARHLRLPPGTFKQVADMKLVVHKTGTLDKLLRLAKGTGPLELIDFFQHEAW